MKRPHKYGAKRTVVDGVTFHSKAEARRYSELKLLEKAGQIHGLVLQPGFPLTVERFDWRDFFPSKIGEYKADFLYCRCLTPHDCKEQVVIEDVKGFKTPLYRWKKKHVEAQYGIEIVEVR